MECVGRKVHGCSSGVVALVPLLACAGPAVAALPMQTATPESGIEICARTALTPGEVWARRSGGLVPGLLAFTYDQCPDVAELLLNGPSMAAATPLAVDGQEDKD